MSLMGKGLNFSESKFFDINRRVIAHSTYNSWKQTPHVSFLYNADVTDFFAFYKKEKSKLSKKTNITFNTIMLKAISEGLKAAPELNSIFEYNPKKKLGDWKLSSDINIAIPYLLEDGRMITPVVKNVESKSLEEISLYIDDLTRRIKNTDIDAMQYAVAFKESFNEIIHLKLGVFRQIFAAKFGKNRVRKPTKADYKAYKKVPECDKINPTDIFDASTLVSNLGSVFKGANSACTLLEIITPQVFVVGINAVQKQAAVVLNKKTKKETIAARDILPLTLTFDHRVCDFANIVPFQKRLEEIFADPKIIKQWATNAN